MDICRTFRHIHIDPGDFDHLGLQHKGNLCLDPSLQFGFHFGAFFFSKITDSVRFIVNKNCHNALLNYIDDLVNCFLPSTFFSFLLVSSGSAPGTWARYQC